MGSSISFETFQEARERMQNINPSVFISQNPPDKMRNFAEHTIGIVTAILENNRCLDEPFRKVLEEEAINLRRHIETIQTESPDSGYFRKAAAAILRIGMAVDFLIYCPLCQLIIPEEARLTCTQTA